MVMIVNAMQSWLFGTLTAQKVKAPIAGWLPTPQCRTVEQYAQYTKIPYVFEPQSKNFQSFFPIEVGLVSHLFVSFRGLLDTHVLLGLLKCCWAFQNSIHLEFILTSI